MLLDVLFPERCLNCNTIIPNDNVVCEPCFEQIHFTHWNFDEEHLMKQKCNLLFPTENAYALMQFEKESLARKIVHDLKYRGREKIGKILSEWIINRLDFKNSKPDLLVSIPLHPKKQRKRGYNQLHLFTEKLSERFSIPYEHNLLKQNYYKKAQALKDREDRTKVQNQFSLNRKIENQHILLIDDVFTTGSRMSSAAWEILKSGNNKVSVLVMAVD